MSNTNERFITVEELSDPNKWLEVLSFSDGTYVMLKVDEFRGYFNLYKKAEALTKGIPDWISVFNALKEDIYVEELDILSEIFLRFVEAHYKTKIKDGNHLEELTGTKRDQYHLDFLADVDIGLDGLVLYAKHFRYEVYLYYLISVTKSYKELTEVKSSDFGLPRGWTLYGDSDKTRTKETMILNTLGYKFYLWEGELTRPPLRDIAKHIEAPYSIILESCINKGPV